MFVKFTIFIIASNQRGHKCLLTVEWMKVVNLHNEILHNSGKRQAATFHSVYKTLTNTTLSNRGQ